MLQRTFHPIGQGAFYSERHQNYNVVYDCGNWKNTKLSSSVVQQSFKINETIDILFISHFDADHVNKIFVLKNHCRKIYNVVLPLLHENEKRLLVNFFLALNRSETANLIHNPRAFFGEETNLIYVEPSDNFDEKLDEINIDQIKKIDDGDFLKIRSGTEIFSKATDWIYVPYNYNYDARKLELEKHFILHGLNIDLFQNDLSYAITHRSKIKAIYNSLTGQINQNSMLVYSGPIAKKYNLVTSYQTGRDFWCEDSRAGCVFTGDADLNIVNINSLFSKYWNEIGTVQIPHHGDIRCFNSNFFDGRNYHCPISVGTNNSYGHPSPIVISSILANSSYPVQITEKLLSGFIQIIAAKR
jgi:hypothetical protein